MNPTRLTEAIEALLPSWLPQQRWFSTATEPPKVAKVVQQEVLRDASPRLWWTLVEVDDVATYQIPIGLREPDELGAVLLGYPNAKIGELEIDGVVHVAYDALVDATLSRVLFDVITDGAQKVKSVRPIGAEQSNSSLVFDNRLILKVFRRLYEGANPDLEVTQALTDAGCDHVAPVIATWEKGDLDLAVCQPYLWDGTEGWALALASIRDFLRADIKGGSSTSGSPSLPLDSADPASAGGDFADEAGRLGRVTGEVHLALAQEFGATPFDVETLVRSLESGLPALSEAQQRSVRRLIDEVSSIATGDAGSAIRIHGDYHLGQTLRASTGWYIFDFEGEPARPLEERIRATSPLKDVAGMLRSFHYAAAVGVREQVPTEQPMLVEGAGAWEERNRNAFRDGYLAVDSVESLLPSDAEARRLLFTAFEVEKAIYEVGYEKAYRPDWVSIPESALARLLG